MGEVLAIDRSILIPEHQCAHQEVCAGGLCGLLVLALGKVAVVGKAHGHIVRVAVHRVAVLCKGMLPARIGFVLKVVLLFRRGDEVFHAQQTPQCIVGKLRFTAHIPLDPQRRVEAEDAGRGGAAEILQTALIQPHADVIVDLVGVDAVVALRQVVFQQQSIRVLLHKVAVGIPLAELANADVHHAEEEGKPRGLAEDATDEEKKAAKAAVKESQKEFTKKLASYADCYVNDAFGTAHRAHASTALIAKYFDKDNKMFGYLMEKEVKAVDKVLNDIQRPFTAIMGGSKVSSKIEIIENLLNKVDNLIIAGGMTYTFTKAMGGKIGISICEDDKLDLALDLVKKAKEKGVNLVLAVDAKIADSFSNDANTKFCPVDEIPDGWEGLDIGPETEKIFADVIKNSKTILWNGPTGVFEFENFTHGSRAVGEAIVEATKNGAFSLVGGGDSVACVNKFGLASGVSYVSTGGGALLEAIEGKILPGIAAINE